MKMSKKDKNFLTGFLKVPLDNKKEAKLLLKNNKFLILHKKIYKFQILKIVLIV